MSLSPRRLLVAVTAVTALAIAGCTGANSGDDASTGESADFSVTLTHAYGETVIDAKPERVVTLGVASSDVVAALGIVPVAIPAEAWSGDADGYTEWFRDYVEDTMQQELPTTLEWEDEPDYEEILELSPDLILAPDSGLTEVQYERLAEIAPTVPHAERAFIYGTWQDLTRVVGSALGESDRAEEVITATEGLVEAKVAEYPNLRGASFVYTLTLGDDGGTELALYISEDPRVVFVRSLGLVDSPSLAERTSGIADDIWYGAVSLEELDTVDTDIVVAWSGSPEETRRTLDNPLVERWDPIANNRYYIGEDKRVGRATMSATPLSVEWLLNHGYVENLSKAIDGDAVIEEAVS